MASVIVKRRPEYGGVVDLSGPDADRHLADFDVADVWGIGPRYAQFLKSDGEENVGQPDLWEASGLPPVLRKQGSRRRWRSSSSHAKGCAARARSAGPGGEALVKEMPTLTDVGQARCTFLGQTVAGGLGTFAQMLPEKESALAAQPPPPEWR